MTFGEELKAWRASARLTQALAAEYLAVPVRSFQEWEQDRSEPNQIGAIRKLIAIYKGDASCAQKS